MQREQTSATLVSAEAGLVRLAQASAAASAASLTVVASCEGLRGLWRNSSAILVGSDQVEEVVRLALPRRDNVYLVGYPDARELLCRWSMPLAASVIQLPDGSKWLSRVIAGRTGGTDVGAVVAIRGGAGGVGASTLAVGVAVAAVRRGLKVALVDCDPLGGGLDLLMGGENTPGWRWDKLRNSSGQIADIRAMLPQVEGVTVVSMERSNPQPVPQGALEAVVDCLGRSHHLVVMDVGRQVMEASVVRRSVVVSAQTVRALAATRVGLGELDLSECGLVVRKGGSVSAHDAARALQLPLITAVPTLADLPRLADRGIAPSLAGAWRRACTTTLQWCMGASQPMRALGDTTPVSLPRSGTLSSRLAGQGDQDQHPARRL